MSLGRIQDWHKIDERMVEAVLRHDRYERCFGVIQIGQGAEDRANGVVGVPDVVLVVYICIDVGQLDEP